MTMDPKTMTVAVDETTAVVAVETQAIELSDAELENVSGGFLDNLAAKCEISGGLNLLSSNVAIELG
jgi:bacteriocin-like protein